MNEDDVKVVESLGVLALALWRDDWDDATRTAKNALTLIERLTADNASLQAQNRRLRKVGQWYAEKHSKARFEARRLTAEVERLTPKPMTLEEACEVMTRAEKGDEHWISKDGWALCYGDNPRGPVGRLTAKEAVYVSQGLLRDAGPTSTRTEAT